MIAAHTSMFLWPSDMYVYTNLVVVLCPTVRLAPDKSYWVKTRFNTGVKVGNIA